MQRFECESDANSKKKKTDKRQEKYDDTSSRTITHTTRHRATPHHPACPVLCLSFCRKKRVSVGVRPSLSVRLTVSVFCVDMFHVC